jgi:hypothetical protein
VIDSIATLLHPLFVGHAAQVMVQGILDNVLVQGLLDVALSLPQVWGQAVSTRSNDRSSRKRLAIEVSPGTDGPFYTNALGPRTTASRPLTC